LGRAANLGGHGFNPGALTAQLTPISEALRTSLLAVVEKIAPMLADGAASERAAVFKGIDDMLETVARSTLSREIGRIQRHFLVRGHHDVLTGPLEQAKGSLHVTVTGLASERLREELIKLEIVRPRSQSSVTVQPPADEPGALATLLGRLGAKGALTAQFTLLLERDGREVELCLQHGAYKGALILSGSILEGVLVGVLSQNTVAEREFQLLPGKQRKPFPKDASLPDLLRLARSSKLKTGLDPLLGDVQEVLGKLVNAHRDLVHPHAEIRDEQLPINEYTAAVAYANLCALLDGVATKIEAGWLDNYREP